MDIGDWDTFQDKFKQYITQTTGLFTLHEPEFFQHLYVPAFLDRILQGINDNKKLSVTQIEVIMALSSFIDIIESIIAININIFPINVQVQIKTLIERGLIQLPPYSSIRYELLNSINL